MRNFLLIVITCLAAVYSEAQYVISESGNAYLRHCSVVEKSTKELTALNSRIL